MKIHRFFLKDIHFEPDYVLKDKEVVHQIVKVLRMKKGERLILFNGDGFDYYFEIKDFSKIELFLKINERKENSFKPKVELHLGVSIIKRDKFEWIIEKGTELGVTSFLPLLTERSEKKNLNFERLRKIAIEATEQSHRSYPPVIHEIQELSDLDLARSTVLDLNGSIIQRDKVLNSLILVGPEGGWTEAEIKLFRDRKSEILSMGSQVLKTETAALSISSILLF